MLKAISNLDISLVAMYAILVWHFTRNFGVHRILDLFPLQRLYGEVSERFQQIQEAESSRYQRDNGKLCENTSENQQTCK